MTTPVGTQQQVKAKPPKALGTISLFSGAGGLDIGFEQAGFKTLSTFDNDHDSVKTLRANALFSDTHVRLGDITEADPELFIADKSMHHGETVVIGGAPCQPFSKNGYWVKNSNRLIERDPRNLLDYFIGVVKHTNPAAFVFENVASILHPSNKEVFSNFVTEISTLDFNVKVLKLDARDFGVPQRRQRVFVVGTKGSFKTDSPPTTHVKDGSDLTGSLPEYVSAGNAIGKFDKSKYSEAEEITTGKTWSDQLYEVPPGKNYLYLTEKRGHPDPVFKYGTRFWNFLLKLHPGDTSWTISANPGPWIGPFHWTSRRLRVPEIAAIQTFPANYKFSGNRRSIQKQIGNAVPPSMARAVAKFVADSLR